MNADETAAYEFLKGYPGIYVSATEVSRRLKGGRRHFLKDRIWARPLLRRMEMDGVLESNMMGEYRLKQAANDALSFKKALARPGSQLADTTLIALDDPDESSDPSDPLAPS